jgi:hypothetical protein
LSARSNKEAKLLNVEAQGKRETYGDLKLEAKDPAGSGFEWVGSLVFHMFSKPDTTVEAIGSEGATNDWAQSVTASFQNNPARYDKAGAYTSTISHSEVDTDSTSGGDAYGEADSAATISTLVLTAS